MKKKILLFVVLFFIIHCLLFINHCKAQWVQISNGMGEDQIICSFAYNGNNIFAGTYFYGVYISSNNGTTWTQTALNNRYVLSLAVSGNNIFAGTDSSGVYFSTNNGTSWSQTTLNNISVFALAIIGNNIFAATNNGVFLTTDNGSTWTQTALYNAVNTLAVIGNNIFAGTYNGVYLSTNNGQNWTQTALNDKSVYSLVTHGNNICVGTDSCVYLSSNNGITWIQSAMLNQTVYSLTISYSNIFAGTSNPGIYLSTNNGTSWAQKNEGFNPNTTISSLIIISNYIYAGTVEQSVWRRELSEIIGIHNISSEVPSKFKLEQNFPNPFNPVTKIKFDIAKKEDRSQNDPEGAPVVKLKIYDITGREIITLVNEQLQPGTYEVTFDGSNFASGIYFYKLISGGFVETKKMLLIK